MALRHCQPPLPCVQSSRNTSARREFFCLRGLKEGVVIFDDVENRVFRSTHRATHSLIASIGARVSPALDGRAHLHPEAEKMLYSEKCVNGPQGSGCFINVGCGMQRDSSCRGYCNVKTSNDSQPDLGLCEAFNSSTMSMNNQPGASLLHSSKPLSNVHVAAPSEFSSPGEIHIPTTPGLHKSYIEVQTTCSIPESCSELPEAPLTPDLQPDLKSWDCDGFRNEDVKVQLCAVSESNIEVDHLILKENDITPGCRSTCIDASESEVFSTDGDTLTVRSYTSFECQEGCNSNRCWLTSHFKSCKFSRAVFDYLDTLNLNICEITYRQKLRFQALQASHLRLKLQKLFWHVKKVSSKGDAGLFSEDLIMLMRFCFRLYKPRHILAQGGRSRAASSFSRISVYMQETLVENAHAWRGGRYMKVNWQFLVLCHQRCFLKGRRHVPPKGLFLKCTISTDEELGQCDRMPYSSVDTNSVSRSPYLLEEVFPRCTEVPSELLDGFQVLPDPFQSSLESKDIFESGTSSHSVSLGMSSASASKLLYLLEIRDGNSTNRTNSSANKMAEPREGQEGPMDSSRSPSSIIVNKFYDHSTLPADKVDNCLDTFRLHSKFHTTWFPYNITPEVRLLDLAPRGIPSIPANRCLESLVEEGFQSVLYVNGNESRASCLPDSEPVSHTPSQCTSSASSIREELHIFMPCRRVHERHNKQRLEHFAEGFLLRRHITRQQQRAQLAPPFPHRHSTVSAWNDQCLRGNPLEQVKTNPYTLCSTKASTPSSTELGMTLTSSAKPCDVAVCYGDSDCLVGADVVIDIVGLTDFIESQCSQLQTFTNVHSNSTEYTHMPMIGGQTVMANFSTVIVTIIAILVYTKTLLEGGLAWVGARTQKEESE